MELKRLKCPTCGASIDGNTIDLTKRTAKCPACDETFIIEQAENFALVEVDKTKDIANYRRNLAIATEKDDAESIKRYAEKILDILPEDYEAGYFYAYAYAKSGDSRYLYDFYNDFDKEYTEESCMRIAEHIVRHGELRDNVLIEKYLKNLKYSAESYLSYYKQVFSEKLSKEELYDDITRDVFICHRSINGDVAERIVKELEDDGNKCWISSRNLRPNDNENYWDNIKRAIKSCRIFLVVSSRDAMLSTDVKKEMAFAKDLNKKRLEVKIDDSEHNSLFKDFFDGCKWIKGENYEEIKARVSDLLLKVLSGADNGVVIHKVKKVNFTPIQEAKAVKKVVVDDLHEHKFQKVQVVPPTCTESGYTLYRCECGEEKKADFTLKRTEHEFKVAERKEPTCTENGFIKYECVYCDATKKDVLPATGHKYKLSDKKEPTCKEEGHEIYKCSVCGDTTVKTLPKTEHPFGRWIVTKIAECESQGEESRQCSFCGKTETRPTPAKGHNYGKWGIEKEPTCTEKGKKVRQCSDCGKKEYSDIEPTGHSFSAWESLPDGKTMERVCDKCGHTERQTSQQYKEQRRAKNLFYSSQVVFILSAIALFVGAIIFFTNISDLRDLKYNKSFLLVVPILLSLIFVLIAFILRKKMVKINSSDHNKMFLTKISKSFAIIFLVTSITCSFALFSLKNEYSGYAEGCYYKNNGDGKTVTLMETDNNALSDNVVIPIDINGYNITGIGDNAFYNCSSLTSVTIPDSVTSIGRVAFYGCHSLKSIYYTGTASQWASIDGLNNIMSSGRTLYINNEPVTSVVLEGITEIKPYAFYDCSKLTNVTIPDSVTSIGESAFSSCSSLESVTIGNSVTSIGERAFFYCSSLSEVTIPDSVTSIGDRAFYHCSGLMSVTIGNSVTSIGELAFYNCSSLTSVTIGNSVTSIGYSAFRGCSSLTSVFYTGMANDWAKISIGHSNTELTSATRYYYREIKPTTAGNYWHYVDGKAVVWE